MPRKSTPRLLDGWHWSVASARPSSIAMLPTISQSQRQAMYNSRSSRRERKKPPSSWLRLLKRSTSLVATAQEKRQLPSLEARQRRICAAPLRLPEPRHCSAPTYRGQPSPCQRGRMLGLLSETAATSMTGALTLARACLFWLRRQQLLYAAAVANHPYGGLGIKARASVFGPVGSVNTCLARGLLLIPVLNFVRQAMKSCLTRLGIRPEGVVDEPSSVACSRSAALLWPRVCTSSACTSSSRKQMLQCFASL